MNYAVDKNRGTRRRKKLIYLFILIISCYGVYNFVHLMNQIEDKQVEVLTLQKDLEAFRKTHQTSQTEIRRLNDPEYVMQRDRKMFHMTKENEIPFILQDNAQ